jgi:hypothetical protein
MRPGHRGKLDVDQHVDVPGCSCRQHPQQPPALALASFRGHPGYFEADMVGKVVVK